MNANWRARSLAGMPALIVLTIVGGLLLDQHGGAYGPIFVSLWVWGVFGLLWLSETPAARTSLLLCLLLALGGELFLALVWGLYVYREGGLPAFVPPGHVLLFWLGMRSVAWVPYGLLRLVPWLGSIACIAVAATGQDTLGLALGGLFLLCWRFGPSPRLYAWMFLLALGMELVGTALGNWRWLPHDPWFGLSMTNPPLAAGAFYCVLDMLVLLGGRRRKPK